MKTFVYFVSGTVLMAAIAYAASAEIVSLMAVNTSQPFTATLAEKRFALDGQEVYSEYLIKAFRSDGSSVLVFRRQSPDGQWRNGRVIVDLSTGARTTVDPNTESITTYPLSAETISHLAEKKDDCSTAQGSEHRTLTGYVTTRAQERLTFPNVDQIIETDKWQAAALNCFPLLSTTIITTDSEQHSGWKVIREVLFVSRAEPDPNFFEIPLNYVERSPSEVMNEFARRFPGRSVNPTTARKLDDAYRSWQDSPQ